MHTASISSRKKFFKSLPYANPHDKSCHDRKVPVIGDGNCTFRAIIQSALIYGILSADPASKDKVVHLLIKLYKQHGENANLRSTSSINKLNMQELMSFISKYKELTINHTQLIDFFTEYFPLEDDGYKYPQGDKIIKFLAYCLRQEVPLLADENKEYVYTSLSDSAIYQYLYQAGFNLTIHYPDINVDAECITIDKHADYHNLLKIHVAIEADGGKHYEVFISSREFKAALNIAYPLQADSLLTEDTASKLANNSIEEPVVTAHQQTKALANTQRENTLVNNNEHSKRSANPKTADSLAIVNQKITPSSTATTKAASTALKPTIAPAKAITKNPSTTVKKPIMPSSKFINQVEKSTVLSKLYAQAKSKTQQIMLKFTAIKRKVETTIGTFIKSIFSSSNNDQRLKAQNSKIARLSNKKVPRIINNAQQSAPIAAPKASVEKTSLVSKEIGRAASNPHVLFSSQSLRAKPTAKNNAQASNPSNRQNNNKPRKLN